ncbi:hypothetical protein [Nonomuraea zeae]|uniref:Uncharacterized protein n=1 Tax=Nonomuraea zeae TaxID=1642303 RepID=A0A5S4FUQ4_9ACTN|nr:hypothetical protein ETD85_46655 [Nonomuraea zeae]
MLKTNSAPPPLQILNYKMPIGDYAVGAAFRKEDDALRHAFDDTHRQLMQDGRCTRSSASGA